MGASKLFVFNRDLPEPFNKVKSKIVKVSSKYGDGTDAKLNVTITKAVNAYCRCVLGSGEGAVGEIDHRSIAEYKSAAGSDAYHLVVYDPSTGNVLASLYDNNTEVVGQYVVGGKERDGAAIALAMMPVFLADEEFEEKYNAYLEDFKNGFPDIAVASEHMAVLCDNAYRRVSDSTCPAHVKLRLEASGNLMRISQTQLDSGKFTPATVIAGDFGIFARSGGAPVLKPIRVIEHSELLGQFSINPGRVLKISEQQLIPTLEPWYIVPPEVIDICKHAARTTGKTAPMRNFLLRGPAGTGKTSAARAVAAAMALPYMKYTCNANTEIFDFVGQVFPEIALPSTGNADSDDERKSLLAMGGITHENVMKLLKMPDLADMDYDPQGVYHSLTGRDNPAATSQDCMAMVLHIVTEKVKQLCQVAPEENSGGQTYTYTETDFIKALKSGYVVELQEPATIMQPGVLVGLNSLLEQAGSITLPTGEVIERHPDTIVVVTTNVDYDGCRGINQSVLDRMNLVLDIELPDAEVMAKRAMSVTGFDDEYAVSQMVQVVNDMADYCHKNGITDGACGMRSLIDWLISTEITGDAYTSALYTVVSKATSNEEDRYALITNCLEPIFPPKRQAV